MWTWHGGLDGWGWIWMTVMMAVVWLPLILAGAWLLRQSGGGAPSRPRDDGSGETHLDAVEIARRAYARGELPREQYLQIADDLQHGGGSRQGGA